MRAFFAFTVLATVLVASSCTLNTEGNLALPPASSGQAAGGTTSASGTGGDGGTTSGTGGTTSSSGTGGNGGTGANDPEDCLDGEDNDGDQDVDCADTDCQPDFECVPEAPTDWTGYVYSTTVAVSATVALCPDSTTPEFHFTTPSGPAQCSACTCGAVQGASCGYPEFACYDDTNSCANGADQSFTDKDGSCHNFSGFWVDYNDSNSCERTQVAGVVSSGSCVPSGGVATVPPPWGAEVRSCLLPEETGGGCSGGEVCVPSAGTDYPTICITREGDHGCPSGWSGETVYGGSNDDRGCSSCACGGASVTCTSGTITIWDAGNCQSGGSGATTVGQSCLQVGAYLDNNSGSYRIDAGTVSGGSCPASGGQPTGDINPVDPFSVCCLP